jgi:hypothetical protein
MRSKCSLLMVSLWVVMIFLIASQAKASEHGPPSDTFPSHKFQWKPHRYDGQLNVHFGLSQPLLLHGFNVASDFRIGRWVFEYSHGMLLNYNAFEPAMKPADVQAGLQLRSPWTTGGGLGYTLFDDFYVMLEVKSHHYRATLFDQEKSYTTVSVGPALAWRFFIWKGLNLTTYVRYWPNVWTSTGNNAIAFQASDGRSHQHNPTNLNFFANLSLGWAFDLVSSPRMNQDQSHVGIFR